MEGSRKRQRTESAETIIERFVTDASCLPDVLSALLDPTFKTHDKRMIISVLTSWTSHSIGLTTDSSVELIDAFCKCEVPLTLEASLKCMYWLTDSQCAEKVFSDRVKALMRVLIMSIFKIRGAVALLTASCVPVKYIREAFHEEKENIASYIPSPEMLLERTRSIWLNVLNDADLLFINQLIKHNVNLEYDSSVVETCIICLGEKLIDNFAQLSCSKHRICADCVVQLFGSSRCARCPMRCRYNVYAVPYAAYEYCRKQFQLAQNLAYTKTSLTRLQYNSIVRKRVEVSSGSFAKIRIGGRLACWVQVENVMANGNLFTVMGDADCKLFLARSDVVLEVENVCIPNQILYSKEDILHLELQLQGTLSFVFFDGVNGTFLTEHYGRIWTTKLFCKVNKSLSLGEPLLSKSSSSDDDKTLWDIYSSRLATMVLPANGVSMCVCTENGKPFKMQRCANCGSYHCVSCYGCAFSLCAICTAQEESIMYI